MNLQWKKKPGELRDLIQLRQEEKTFLREEKKNTKNTRNKKFYAVDSMLLSPSWNFIRSVTLSPGPSFTILTPCVALPITLIFFNVVLITIPLAVVIIIE